MLYLSFNIKKGEMSYMQNSIFLQKGNDMLHTENWDGHYDQVLYNYLDSSQEEEQEEIYECSVCGRSFLNEDIEVYSPCICKVCAQDAYTFELGDEITYLGATGEITHIFRDSKQIVVYFEETKKREYFHFDEFHVFKEV